MAFGAGHPGRIPDQVDRSERQRRGGGYARERDERPRATPHLILTR